MIEGINNKPLPYNKIEGINGRLKPRFILWIYKLSSKISVGLKINFKGFRINKGK